jgi:hypothetical protein
MFPWNGQRIYLGCLYFTKDRRFATVLQQFLSSPPVCIKNYSDVGRAVDRFVDAINRCFNYFPLLNRDRKSLFEIQAISFSPNGHPPSARSSNV